MSTEQEATPPARIWTQTPHVKTESGNSGLYYSVPIPKTTEYIRADSFDTMRDALREIAKGVQVGDDCAIDAIVRLKALASSALASIDADGDGRKVKQ